MNKTFAFIAALALALLPARLLAEETADTLSERHYLAPGKLTLTPDNSAYKWSARVGMQTYFDNLEFQGCDYAMSQTMAGVRVSPEVGLKWNDFKVAVGAHAQKRYGTLQFIDDFDFTAYFAYNHQNSRMVSTTFLMGAFPRNGLLDNYSNLFFRDSIRYMRPNLNGIFYQVNGWGRGNNLANVWLDWTGWQTATERETFFVGFSGDQTIRCWEQRNRVNVELQGYYFHYANTSPRSGDECVHDNAQVQISVGYRYGPIGIDRPNKRPFISIKAGLMAGYECKRDGGTTPKKHPLGLVVDLNAQYWKIGTHTLYYYGDRRQTVPTDNHAATYWGNPLTQSGSYLQSHWYYEMFHWKRVQARVGWTFHLVGSELYHQQALRLNVQLP